MYIVKFHKIYVHTKKTTLTNLKRDQTNLMIDVILTRYNAKKSILVNNSFKVSYT